MKRITARGWFWITATLACVAFYGWLLGALS